MARKKRQDDYDKIEVYIEEIGPAEATELLKHNHFNRKMKKHKVQAYARDMKAGDWAICNDAICIDPKGRLLNGQNRMRAIVESRATVNMVVMHGVPTDSFKTMDSGAPRNIQDALILDGCDARYARVVGQICRGAYLFDLGKLYTIASGGGALIVSHSELLKVWRKDAANILQAAAWNVDTHQNAVKIYPMRVLRYLTVRAHSRLGKEFTDHVRDGGPSIMHPGQRLRVAYEKHKQANQFPDKRGYLSRAQQMAYAIIAWNAFFLKEPLKVLRWKILTTTEISQYNANAKPGDPSANDAHFPTLEL